MTTLPFALPPSMGQELAARNAQRLEIHLSKSLEREVVVADHGPGIADGELGLVFEKGYRGAHVRGSRVGSGLGLALVRAIVAWHGGAVSAERGTRGGTSIVILLPNDQEMA